jgi:soluble lytic murein transglycosylase-like protein
MISGISSQFTAGSGIAAVEARVRQLEAKLGVLQQQQQIPQLSPLSPNNAMQKTGFQSALQAVMQNEGVASGTNNAINKLSGLIQSAAQETGVDAKLLQAVIQQESGFNPNAISKAGAQGLMQLMPATATSLGVSDPFDPVQNVIGGARHLKSLLSRYNGNIPLALAAYNAGAGAVSKHGGIPPYAETQQYVQKILKNYLHLRQSA